MKVTGSNPAALSATRRNSKLTNNSVDVRQKRYGPLEVMFLLSYQMPPDLSSAVQRSWWGRMIQATRCISVRKHETQSNRESCVFHFSHFELYFALHSCVSSTLQQHLLLFPTIDFYNNDDIAFMQHFSFLSGCALDPFAEDYDRIASNNLQRKEGNKDMGIYMAYGVNFA